MTDLRAAARQALEALMWHDETVRTRGDNEAITALRAALAQQERVIRGLHSITNEDNGLLTLCFADETSAEAFMASHTGDADEALIQRAALAQQEATGKESLPVDCPACGGGGLIPDPTWDWVRCELCHQRRARAIETALKEKNQ
jgi:hypothetical protein